MSCFCLPTELVSTFGFKQFSLNGIAVRRLQADDFVGGREAFRAGTVELPFDSQSLDATSVACTLIISLGVTGDSESDDDGLLLLISYKTLFDITGSSE